MRSGWIALDVGRPIRAGGARHRRLDFAYANDIREVWPISERPSRTGVKTPPDTRIAQLFRNGANQAVRLPWDLELDADEVVIRRDGDSLILTPRPRTCDDDFARARRLDRDFPDPRELRPADERDPF